MYINKTFRSNNYPFKNGGLLAVKRVEQNLFSNERLFSNLLQIIKNNRTNAKLCLTLGIDGVKN